MWTSFRGIEEDNGVLYNNISIYNLISYFLRKTFNLSSIISSSSFSLFVCIHHSSFINFYLFSIFHFAHIQASISNVVEWHHEHNPQTIKLFHQEENSRVQLANDWHEIAKAVSILSYCIFIYSSILYFDSEFDR